MYRQRGSYVINNCGWKKKPRHQPPIGVAIFEKNFLYVPFPFFAVVWSLKFKTSTQQLFNNWGLIK